MSKDENQKREEQIASCCLEILSLRASEIASSALALSSEFSLCKQEVDALMEKEEQ